MLLSLPPIFQQAGHDCGEAAVKCLLGYYGVTAATKFATPIDGADPRQLESALRRIGFHVLSGEMTAAMLGHFADEGHPVICLITPPGEDSHWTVSRGISRGRHYVHCVWDGPLSFSAAEWDAMWSAHGRLGERYTRWGLAAWPG